MGSSGLEPPTSRLSGARSNRLSYEPINSGNHLLSQAVPRQVSSTVYVLTVVFGMDTGVPHKRIVTGNLFQVSTPSKLNTRYIIVILSYFVNTFLFLFFYFFLLFLLFRSSPRSISIGQLNTLLYLHLQPIYLVVFKGPYSLAFWDILS